MARPRRATGNLPDREPLRWTADKAAREFEVTEYLIRKRLKDGAEHPGPDGCYGTGQLHKVMFGSLHAERLRKTAAEADGVEMANSITRADYLDRQELSKAFAEIADAMQQVVRNSPLNRREQDDLLLQLSSVPVAIENTARAHARWRDNGAGSEAGATTPRKKRGRRRARANIPTVTG
jgi:hypothetical protein